MTTFETPDRDVLRGSHASYDVVFLRNGEELRAYRSGDHTNKAENARERCEAMGSTVFWDHGDGLFTWVCPSCGAANLGTFGDQPVSGWDNPRWLATGPYHLLTLQPSLGCPTWHSGRCDGHWWLREGRLIHA